MKKQPTKLGDTWREMAPPPARSSDDFWDDFRARAALVPQATPQRTRASSARWLYAVGAAAALVVAVFSVSHLLTGPAGGRKALASAPAASAGAVSRIEEVQVFVDDASVMVFEDAENGGTVVFVETSPSPNHT